MDRNLKVTLFDVLQIVDAMYDSERYDGDSLTKLGELAGKLTDDEVINYANFRRQQINGGGMFTYQAVIKNLCIFKSNYCSKG